VKFLQVGFKVNDIERASRAYAELFGLQWEPVKEFTMQHRVGDHVGPVRSRVTHAWTDDGTEIELVETAEGHSVDVELMGEREGISHIAFQVDDLAAERAKFEAKGVRIVGEGTAPRASWFFVMDDRLAGAVVQIVQLHEKSAA
jgi:catechol 2,3-dioxygenase-like lactoylglutathione lyase family enzyme